MPDTLCRLGKKEVGIEVVHTYGTGAEAAMRLGNLEAKDIPEGTHQLRCTIPLDIRTLRSLNQVLKDKATRRYAFSPIWLLIRNAVIPWTLADYKEHRHQIRVPERHPFQQIWLVSDATSIGQQGLMRLA